MTRPTTSIDVFSPAAYLDDQAVADKFAALRAEGDIFWVEQSPYRPFWAVLRQEDIMSVERNTKVWLNAPRLVIMPSAAEDETIAQFGVAVAAFIVDCIHALLQFKDSDVMILRCDGNASTFKQIGLCGHVNPVVHG